MSKWAVRATTAPTDAPEGGDAVVPPVVAANEGMGVKYGAQGDKKPDQLVANRVGAGFPVAAPL